MLKITNVQIWFRLLVVVLMLSVLASCGYNDNLHVQHRQLIMLWYDEFDPLEESLNKQYALLKKGELRPLDFSLQIQSLEYANTGIDQHFERYIQAKPNSRWPHLLYGLYLIKQASDARGGRSYSQTPKVKINKMHQLLMQAMPLMQTARDKQAPIGLYASGWIKMQMLLGSKAVSSDGDLRDLVQEALARDGEIWRAPYAYMQTLYPQWGGSERAMQRYIDQVKPGNPLLADALQADFYWSRGVRYRTRGLDQQATTTFEKAVSIYPDSLALNALGNQYMKSRRCDDAVDVFDRNLEENDPWDLYTIELAMQANRCAGNSLKANRLSTKRAKLFSRYRNGE